MKIDIGDNVYWFLFWIIVAIVIIWPIDKVKQDPIAERINAIKYLGLSNAQSVELIKAIVVNGTNGTNEVNCTVKKETILEK